MNRVLAIISDDEVLRAICAEASSEKARLDERIRFVQAQIDSIKKNRKEIEERHTLTIVERIKFLGKYPEQFNQKDGDSLVVDVEGDAIIFHRCDNSCSHRFLDYIDTFTK